FDLSEPGTILFTAERAFHGRHLTAFCLSLRERDNRSTFLAEPSAYMSRCGLTTDEQQLVNDRNWTELLRRGAHLQSVLKLAATYGGNLFDIGAHNVGSSIDQLVESCPRTVSRLPKEL
ncbi:hypothetical protein, partial [Rhodococcus sp. LB1]|uniref:hypothetical protein n=1 Tax=Rhodococcus sp. LB1 TaxID=1807499 RepID=UPI00077A7694